MEEIDFDRYIVTADGIYSKYFKRRLRGHPTVDGYYLVKLYLKNGKTKDFYYHRVIWYYFNGDIPKNLQVNHIDENKANNSLSNLELLSPKDNINYGKRSDKNGLKRKGTHTKKVYQYSLDGILLNVFNSARECERKTEYCQANISKACNGVFKTYKNFIWSYEEK